MPLSDEKFIVSTQEDMEVYQELDQVVQVLVLDRLHLEELVLMALVLMALVLMALVQEVLDQEE